MEEYLKKVTPLHKLGRKPTFDDIRLMAQSDNSVGAMVKAYDCGALSKENLLIYLVYDLYTEKTKYFNDILRLL